MSEQVCSNAKRNRACRRAVPARRLLASAFGVLTFAAGCSGPVMNRWTYSEAVIEGRLSDPNGAPVRDASVDILVFQDACRDTGEPTTVTFLRSDEAGRFDARIRSVPAGNAFDACLSIRTRAPASSGLRDTTVTGHRVTFRPPAPDVVLDTVRAEIRLSP
jgi:hypothetical protein